MISHNCNSNWLLLMSPQSSQIVTLYIVSPLHMIPRLQYIKAVLNLTALYLVYSTSAPGRVKRLTIKCT